MTKDPWHGPLAERLAGLSYALRLEPCALRRGLATYTGLNQVMDELIQMLNLLEEN